MRSLERIKEGRRARLRAEVQHRLHAKPVVYSCVYKITDHENQYHMGWLSVTSVDIDLAVLRSQGTMNLAHQRVKITLAKLKENLTCSSRK